MGGGGVPNWHCSYVELDWTPLETDDTHRSYIDVGYRRSPTNLPSRRGICRVVEHPKEPEAEVSAIGLHWSPPIYDDLRCVALTTRDHRTPSSIGGDRR